MINPAIELLSELPGSNPTEPSSTSHETYECDWCGRAVTRETASERSGGDTGEVVLLCGPCAHGID